MAHAPADGPVSTAARLLAHEVGRAWLARPWRPVDRETIDAFHKAAVDGDSERIGQMLEEAGRFGAAALLELGLGHSAVLDGALQAAASAALARRVAHRAETSQAPTHPLPALTLSSTS